MYLWIYIEIDTIVQIEAKSHARKINSIKISLRPPKYINCLFFLESVSVESIESTQVLITLSRYSIALASALLLSDSLVNPNCLFLSLLLVGKTHFQAIVLPLELPRPGIAQMC